MTNQSTNNPSRSGGIGFTGALGLLFIGLKLGHVVHWPWWAVTLPLWGGLALVIAIIVAVVLVTVIGKAVSR